MSSSLLKSIAATLVSPRAGAVVTLLIVLLWIVLFAPTAPLRAAEPSGIAQIRLPTPTPNVAQAQGDQASVAQQSPEQEPTAIPTVEDPIGTVLVERLRLRAGPGEEYAILERVFPGDLLALQGQADGCSWLFVTSPSGQRGWVSGEASLVALNVGCTLLLPVDFIIPTPTISPTPSLSPTPTSTRTATPTRTVTPTPTATPLAAPEIALRPAISPWTPTPVPTPTRRPAATATPTAMIAIQPTRDPLASLAVGGPQTVFGMLPESGTESRVRIPFSWSTDAPLAAGQIFEVAFWQKGQSIEEAHGWTGATTNYTLSANTYEQVPGDYHWGVWLGAMVDGVYHRLRYLGGDNLLRVLPEAEVEVVAPAATNCPPTAPCK